MFNFTICHRTEHPHTDGKMILVPVAGSNSQPEAQLILEALKKSDAANTHRTSNRQLVLCELDEVHTPVKNY